MALTRVPGPPALVRPVLHAVWPLVGVVVTIVSGPVIVATAFHSLVDRRARAFRIVVLAVLAMWVDIGMLVRCWALTREIPDQESEAWRIAHEELFAATLDRVMGLAKRWVGFEVRLADRMDFGDPDAPLIAFARHAGPGDSLALAWLLSRTAGRLPRIVLAEALRWDPGVDTILTRLQAYFVPFDRSHDRTRGVGALASSLRVGDVLLLFPEGQNWSEDRKLGLIRKLRARGTDRRSWQAIWRAARLRHVLPPRSGGVVAAMSARPDADVMILAHAGLERITSARDLWDALPFRGRPMVVTSWTYAAGTLPDDPPGIAEWLDAQWDEVDGWVADHSPDPSIRAESGWIRLEDDDEDGPRRSAPSRSGG